MKSRRLFLLMAIAAACGCNSGGGDRPAADSVIRETVSLTKTEWPEDPPAPPPAFPGLFARIARFDSSFRPARFEPMAPYGSIDRVEVRQFEPGELERWKPFLIYNADSSAAIDRYSYGYELRRAADGRLQPVEIGDADMEVALVDARSGHRTRLFFGGPGAHDLDVRWESLQVVELATAEVVDRDRYQLSVQRYRLPEGHRFLAQYPDTLRGFRQLVAGEKHSGF
ncbi:MAG: hypothetical protein EOO16_16890 [Chitinophagaceae bacterium]|nr:MAG: hypothetical protein EOO16_16890 [Chitinophagaceae bacterium]